MKNFAQPLVQRLPDGLGGAKGLETSDWDASPPTPGALIAQTLLFLRRNARRIATVSALTGLAAFGAGYFLFNKYSAIAMIVVEPRASKITQAGGVLANTGLDNTAVDSLALIAKSDGFLGALVDNLALTLDPDIGVGGPSAAAARLATIAKLSSRLNVARRGATYVLEVSASAASAENSARIANAAAKMIVDGQSGLRSAANQSTAAGIQVRLAEMSQRVDAAEKAAADLKSQLKVTDAGQGSTLLQRRVEELNKQLVLAGAKKGEARARYEQLRRAGSGAGESLAPAAQSSVLSSLRVEYVRLSRQSADQATVLGARHPDVASLRAQLDDLRRQIAAEIARLSNAAHNDVLQADQEEASLARELKAAQNESGDLGPQLVKLDELERQAKAERSVYEELLTRQKELSQTKDLDPNDVRLVSAALAPAKTTPSHTILAAASTLLGLLAGLGAAWAREGARQTLRTANQAERASGLMLAALAPRLHGEDGAPEDGAQPFDITLWLADYCAALELGHERGGGAILVASARRGEGRSTVAASLAASLARAGERVLLIDADRARAAGPRAEFGLIDVLERGSDLKRAFIERDDGVTLLPFGGRTVRAKGAANALMSGVKLRALLRLCRRWFDVIVIDGPPALEAGHAGFLARLADHTAFVAAWDETSRADVAQAVARLGARRASLILNKVDRARYGLYDPEQAYRLANPPMTQSEAA